MKEKLIQYVDLLFAGTPGTEDIKQEILQNTLDRFDDLTSQGKSPEAAYSLAISGIGDVSELLGSNTASSPAEPVYYAPVEESAPESENTSGQQKYMSAAAIAMYICCVVPVIIFSPLGLETLGICLMFLLIAAATALLIIAGSSEKKEPMAKAEKRTPQQELNKVLGTVTLVLYLIVSFASGAWYITWLIFPIAAAVKGLVKAILDLKEAKKHEN